jgi:hypothetical protein
MLMGALCRHILQLKIDLLAQIHFLCLMEGTRQYTRHHSRDCRLHSDVFSKAVAKLSTSMSFETQLLPEFRSEYMQNFTMGCLMLSST